MNAALSEEFQLIEDPPVSVVRYPVTRWKKTADARLESVAKYCELEIGRIEKEIGRIDVLLAGGWSAACWAVELGNRLCVPAVVVEHSNPLTNPGLQKDDMQREIYLKAIANATILCVVSPSLRNWTIALAEDNAGIYPVVVGNLVDTEFFCPCGKKEKLSEYKMLTVASRSRHKDVDTFIKAVGHVRKLKESLPLRAEVMGIEGPAKDYYAQLCSRCGVSDIVQIGDGKQGRREVREAMQNADVFVSSSIYETFGIVMAEALACGTPVVATRSGGAEYILGESSPFLVDVRDPVGLASKIIEVAQGAIPFNPTQARQDIVKRFGERAFVARMMNILTSAVAMHKKSHL